MSGTLFVFQQILEAADNLSISNEAIIGLLKGTRPAPPPPPTLFFVLTSLFTILLSSSSPPSLSSLTLLPSLSSPLSPPSLSPPLSSSPLSLLPSLSPPSLVCSQVQLRSYQKCLMKRLRQEFVVCAGYKPHL